MSIRPIQIEVTLYLGQTDPGSWDVEYAYYWNNTLGKEGQVQQLTHCPWVG